MQIKYHTTHQYIPAPLLPSSRLILLGMEAASHGSRQTVLPTSPSAPSCLDFSAYPFSHPTSNSFTYHHCMGTLPNISRPFFSYMWWVDGTMGKYPLPCIPTLCPYPYLCTRWVAQGLLCPQQVLPGGRWELMWHICGWIWWG